MKKISTLLLLFTSIAFNVFAQNEDNIWFFGNSAGLNFNTGIPTAIAGGATTASDGDNCSAISDSVGNILFYSDGMTVWNKNNVTMYNGTGLLGSSTGGQCALIVPQPMSANIYYVFTLDAQAGPNGLHYSVVDMSQQAGLGAVTTKNVLLFTPSTEKIDAVYSVADTAYWVLTHRWNSNNFNAYKISPSGIDTVPVISSVGSVNTGGSPNGYNAMGQMTFSKDGARLASAIYSDGKIELFDFNTTTGVVSNPLTITGYTDAWGTAFSEDGTKLYLTQWMRDSVYQFDLTNYVLANIEASVKVIGHATGIGGYQAGYLQIGSDNKIYVARWNESYVGVINNPDSLGTKCNYVNNGVSLASGVCQAGLCRDVPVYHKSREGINELSHKSDIQVYPSPNDGIFYVKTKNINKTMYIEIYDVLGKTVYTSKMNSLVNKIQLNAPAGIYLYKVIDNNSILKSGKLIIE